MRTQDDSNNQKLKMDNLSYLKILQWVTPFVHWMSRSISKNQMAKIVDVMSFHS